MPNNNGDNHVDKIVWHIIMLLYLCVMNKKFNKMVAESMTKLLSKHELTWDSYKYKIKFRVSKVMDPRSESSQCLYDYVIEVLSVKEKQFVYGKTPGTYLRDERGTRISEWVDIVKPRRRDINMLNVRIRLQCSRSVDCTFQIFSVSPWRYSRTNPKVLWPKQ